MPYFKKYFFLLCLALAACGCFQEEFGQKHAHYELGVSLNLPESWTRAEISPVATLSSMAFEDGKGGMVVLTRNFGSTFKEQLDFVRKIYYPVHEKGLILFARNKTRWFRTVEKRTETIVYVIKASRGRVFTVTCSCPSIDFVSYRPEFDRIARSLRVF